VKEVRKEEEETPRNRQRGGAGGSGGGYKNGGGRGARNYVGVNNRRDSGGNNQRRVSPQSFKNKNRRFTYVCSTVNYWCREEEGGGWLSILVLDRFSTVYKTEVELAV